MNYTYIIHVARKRFWSIEADYGEAWSDNLAPFFEHYFEELE